ncbi:MAG TPA: CheR family methyltransferase [Verrucomicrobiota bacterium]|nr:CheR family methyltransferase [Verrucomicrobiota bacterium]
MDGDTFERIRRLASRLMGIALLDRHREPLGRRGRRAGLNTRDDWAELLDAVEAGGAEAVQRLAGLVTVRHTGFFRHPEHFTLAARHARAAARHRGRARLWCAATATGEEAWSLALALLEASGADDPPATVLATDLHAASLAEAEQAEYAPTALAALGAGRGTRWTAPVAGGQRLRLRLAPAVRRLVVFQPLNLAAEAWPVTGPFDVIFCRNVLMYLGADHRYAVLERLASLLAADGLLLLDPAEHPGPAAHWYSSLGAGAYVRRRGLPASRRGGRRRPAEIMP